jgi:hypothetical protein
MTAHLVDALLSGVRAEINRVRVVESSKGYDYVGFLSWAYDSGIRDNGALG